MGGGFGLVVGAGEFEAGGGLRLCGLSVAAGGVVALGALVARAIGDGDGALLVAHAVRTSAKIAPSNARPNVMPVPNRNRRASTPVGSGYPLETPGTTRCDTVCQGERVEA